MNFIPFSKQELDRIYRIVFANASEHFLDEWCAAIKVTEQKEKKRKDSFVCVRKKQKEGS